MEMSACVTIRVDERYIVDGMGFYMYVLASLGNSELGTDQSHWGLSAWASTYIRSFHRR
jgi:hypothetical protein